MLPLSISEAIAREEGFYVHGSRANRNNNPGNIEYGAFSRAFGSTHGDPRFAVFNSPDDGFKCLSTLLSKHYSGLTIAAAIAKWAPPTENNTAQYVLNVCAWTELTPDTIIDGYIYARDNSPQSPAPTTTISNSGGLVV